MLGVSAVECLPIYQFVDIIYDNMNLNFKMNYLQGIFGAQEYPFSFILTIRPIHCPFYEKIGVCRHGNKCSRHHRPITKSKTILLAHSFPLEEKEVNQDSLDHFVADMHEEFSKYGKVEEIAVCANQAEFLKGNTFVVFQDEEDASRAVLAGILIRYF